MRSIIELQQYKKCLVVFVSGVVCSVLAFAIYIINPVNMIVQYNLNMSPNSMIFNVWRKPKIEIFLYVYVFNITNSEAFINGDDKNLKVQELGPYVYQEFLESTNITWNDNGTLSYIPRRSAKFRLDMSVGNPEEDFITVTNIPMLGIFSALHDAGFFVNYPFVQLTNFLDSQPILHISVYDYLWGYEDSLVNLAGTVVPSYINFKKFGLLDRLYDEGDTIINMNLKDNHNMVDEIGRYLSIETINNSPGLPNWGYVEVTGNETRPENSICNRAQGTTEATVFPKNVDERARFRVFRKAFCHPIPLVFKQKTEVYGLQGLDFTIEENFADPPELNPENECLCRNKQCLKKGLLDLTPCYYKIPTAASMPHFLNTDPAVGDRIEGLKPDYEKHRTIVVVEPTTGIPMYIHSRIQTNLIMKDTHYNSKVLPFNNLTIPLFWNDLVIYELPSDLLFLLRFGINVAPTLQIVVMILLAIGGLSCICWSLIRALVIVQEEQQRQEATNVERRDSADPRIPLDYGQYPGIRIVPAIKKITSKTDLFV